MSLQREKDNYSMTYAISSSSTINSNNNTITVATTNSNNNNPKMNFFYLCSRFSTLRLAPQLDLSTLNGPVHLALRHQPRRVGGGEHGQGRVSWPDGFDAFRGPDLALEPSVVLELDRVDVQRVITWNGGQIVMNLTPKGAGLG